MKRTHSYCNPPSHLYNRCEVIKPVSLLGEFTELGVLKQINKTEQTSDRGFGWLEVALTGGREGVSPAEQFSVEPPLPILHHITYFPDLHLRALLL